MNEMQMQVLLQVDVEELASELLDWIANREKTIAAVRNLAESIVENTKSKQWGEVGGAIMSLASLLLSGIPGMVVGFGSIGVSTYTARRANDLITDRAQRVQSDVIDDEWVMEELKKIIKKILEEHDNRPVDEEAAGNIAQSALQSICGEHSSKSKQNFETAGNAFASNAPSTCGDVAKENTQKIASSATAQSNGFGGNFFKCLGWLFTLKTVCDSTSTLRKVYQTYENVPECARLLYTFIDELQSELNYYIPIPNLL